MASLGIFVAVGNDFSLTNVVATTATPSACWTPGGTITNITFLSGIGWSPDLSQFVASGSYTRTIATSADGITWTPRPCPFDGNQGNFTPSWSPTLGLWVVAGSSDPSSVTIITSPDGVTWTAQTSPFDDAARSDNGGFGACWSPELGLFVVVGLNHNTSALVATSPDGVTWTRQTTPEDNAGTGLSGIAWSPELGLFVAGGFAHLMTSADGVTWTSQTIPGTSPAVNQACWSSDLGLFVITGSGFGAGESVITSSDGSTWTPQTTPGTLSGGICWSPEQGLFVAGIDDTFMTSPDGVTWTIADCPILTGVHAHSRAHHFA